MKTACIERQIPRTRDYRLYAKALAFFTAAFTIGTVCGIAVTEPNAKPEVEDENRIVHYGSRLTANPHGETERTRLVDIERADAKALATDDPHQLLTMLGIAYTDRVVAVGDYQVAKAEPHGPVTRAIQRSVEQNFVDLLLMRDGKLLRVVVLLHDR